ncbi:MAG: hypothetical protein WBO49_00835 [Candidatus Saccharimonas sp.]
MKKQTNRQKKIIIIVVVAIVLLCIDLFLTGYLRFAFNMARCRTTPVAIQKPGFGVGSPSYWLPGKYTPGGADTVYFCSENEAMNAGYRKNPLQGN